MAKSNKGLRNSNNTLRFKMSYKDTLNLPKTDFSMKANLTALEPKIIAAWEKVKIYFSLRKERKGRPKFILHDGPPYANGLIHIGHALNKGLELHPDILNLR